MRNRLALLAALALAACGGGTSAPSSVQPPQQPAPPPIASAVRYAGCPVFAADDAYNTPVTGGALDAHSAQYVVSMVAGGHRGSGMYVFFNAVNVASNATPLVPIAFTAHSDPSGATKWPWASSFAIAPNQDHHAIVVQRDSCRVYETYDTHFANGTLTAYSGADWDMHAAFAPLPYDTPSSLASGLSLFAGMIKAAEIQRGVIDHELNLAVPAGSVAAHLFVRPAAYTGGAPYTGNDPAHELPWGAHLRLKTSYDISGYPPQTRAILQALKTYGAYVADTGQAGGDIALYGESSTVWNANDIATLDNVPWSQFEVMPLGQIICDPGFPCP